MSFPAEGQQPRRPPGSRTPGAAPDPQTILLRRAVAAGVLVLLLILLVVGVRGCLNARTDRAFRDYAADVRGLLSDSSNLSDQLFELLSKPGGSDELDTEKQVNALPIEAAQLVERADSTDHPDELDGAHDWVVNALEFRRDALDRIAGKLPVALGKKGRGQTIESIAAQMQAFLASDVIYSQRALPALVREFRERQLTDERFPKSQSLPDLSWLTPTTIQSRLSRIGGPGQAATPGLHGSGLQGVTAKPSGTALTEDGANRIPATAKLTFEVQVQNQGESEETDVGVSVSIRDGQRIDVEQNIPRIEAGETETISVPIPRRPRTGSLSKVTIRIAPVPGEKITDNNKATYQVVFTTS